MRVVRALLAILLILGAPLARAAIEAPGPANVSFAELERFRKDGVPDERWPALMETLGTEEQRASVRNFVREMKPFPAAKLVSLLTHPRLAARLGALELLEDAAGETFEFDPWQEAAADGANQEALSRWRKWAEKGEVKSANDLPPLTDETFRVLAQEITGGNADRAERAMRRLDAYGLAVIAPIERFLQEQTGLEGMPRAMLKQAQYRVVIAQTLPKQAAALARELALGLPEAQSTALGGLGAAGSAVLPIVSEFIASPDPLVRESAADAAFAAGGREAVPIVLAQMKQEQAESVLHAMLRGLGKFASGETETAAIAALLEHPSENVVVGAAEALGFNSSGEQRKAIEKALADPRWRVRAAALETIGKRSLAQSADAVKKCFADPEIFVRVTAVQTIARIAGGAEAVLLEQFEKQHDLKPAILATFFSSGKRTPPEKAWELLQTAPPEVILQCLESLESRDDYEHKRVVHADRFARHPNKDVSAAALRIMATYGRSTNLLLEALQSKDPVRVDAVLDALRLKPAFFGGQGVAVPAPVPAAQRQGNPTLDRLYESVRISSRPGVPSSPPPGSAGEANPAVFSEVLRGFLKNGSAHQQLRAALVLFPSGDAEAREHLLKVFATLAPIDRRAIAGGLAGLSDWTPARSLATRLLQDPADDVRETAIESWMHNPSRIGELLTEVTREGSVVGPAEIYDWNFDRVLESGAANAQIGEWARRVLADPQSRDAHKAFAIVLIDRARMIREIPVETFIKSENAVLRRATYRALGLAHAEANLDALLQDDSALTRQVLPFLAAPSNNTWKHFFDDASYVDDHQDHQRERSAPKFGAWAGGGKPAGGRVSDAVISALEKLARDPAETVRFEAMFALLRLGRPVDPKALASAVASQPPDQHARQRLGDFLESDFARLGPAYAVLVPLAQGITPDRHAQIQSHFKLQKKASPTTFVELAKLAPATLPADNRIAPAPVPAERPPTAGTGFKVLFFHKVGCRECERARKILAEQAANFPGAKIEERDIDHTEQAVLNEALSTRFQIRDTLHQVTPAIFTQTGALVKDEITFPAVGDLLRSAQAAPSAEGWDRAEAGEIVAAQDTIQERYAALSLGVVGMAGLLDGINPCAFATIIFLLSYLQVARRSPGEILAVGAAFVGAVFLAYFLVGLGLVQIIGRLDGMRVVGNVLNYVLAGFALVLALFSFRDAQLASRGQMAEMTLQLPGSLKEQIRAAIRTSAKARRFVIGAFVAGIVISLLELACTGQVYLPTILYMVRSGRGEAMFHLLAYNVAFVLPLIIVFILAWAGMRSDALLKFQQRHVVLVKVMTGVLFLGLTVFLLFGHAIIPLVASAATP